MGHIVEDIPCAAMRIVIRLPFSGEIFASRPGLSAVGQRALRCIFSSFGAYTRSILDLIRNQGRLSVPLASLLARIACFTTFTSLRDATALDRVRSLSFTNTSRGE